jgi:hypothetical protein
MTAMRAQKLERTPDRALAGRRTSMLLLAVVSACWPRGRRQIGTYIGVTAAHFGALSYRWVDYPGAVPQAWALAVMCWGLGIALWAWWSTFRLKDNGPATDRPRRAGQA